MTQPTYSTESWLFFLMSMMLMSGASNVLLKDFMCVVNAPTGSAEQPTQDFNRPIMWSVLMKAGMALCLFFRPKMPTAPLRIFMLSCTLGFLTDVLVNCAYTAIAGSAIQMLRGGKILFTAALSYLFLGRRLQPFQMFGAFLVVIGITFVGVSAYLTPPRQAEGTAAVKSHATMIAMLSCLLGEISQAILWVYQESVLKAYDIHPLQLVGIEGWMGVVLGVGALVVAHAANIENMEESIHQLTHSRVLIASVMALLASMAIFNYSGVGVTKSGSAVARSIIDVSRAVVIWTVELALRWHEFSWFQLCGFAILAYGALTYNHILPAPCLPEALTSEHSPMLPKSGVTLDRAEKASSEL
mmetsp:Transcript_43752/g.103357  ORF Transcript_43752/g.103357 Transcript_43752/m.103357 type:complete len:357 (+) Transcript_43752:279-1349(+)|eukprot:CAMPEP_0178452266 /NCGR_PEP_ID=MMETSP0689_2-20121128/44149_1 /TAXON_ID=160604 /ORGANISM="Amphidinium massartii, Strain CS-259" /LENGTH=356 /DNA_ID=CAMNT_0020077953 /DNA_START=190 /DNA_END=1260 /DNA_ORIENTATION=+